MEMNLNKEQLTKIKEEIVKRINILYACAMDYQTQLKKIDEMLKALEPKEEKVEEKPAESSTAECKK